SSKAILAFTDPDTAKGMLEPLMADDQKTAMHALLQELDDIGRHGDAMCDGEIGEGAFSIACPVRSGTQHAAYTIGGAGTSTRLKSHGIPQLVNVLQAATQQAVAEILNV